MYRSIIAVLVFCALSICAFTHYRAPPNVNAAMRECVEKLGVNDSRMRKIYRYEELNDPQFQCLHSCIMKSLHYMNGDEVDDREEAIDRIFEQSSDRERFIDAFNNVCANEEGIDECITARRIHKCMMSQMHRRHRK